METTTQEFRQALLRNKEAVVYRSRFYSGNGNVELSATEKELRVASTDGESYVITTTHGKFEDFVFHAPLKPLFSFAGKRNGKLTLARNADRLLLQAEEVGRVAVVEQENKGFPSIPKYNVTWHKLPEEFFRMLKIVSMGCATDESRPVLAAVYFSDGKLAAADGFRLYAYENPGFKFGLKDKVGLVPYSVVKKALRIFAGMPTEIGFDLENKWVVFRSEGVVLIGCLVSGTYPKYEQLIPHNYDASVTFSVPLLLERLALISGVDSEITRLFLNDKTWELTSGEPELAEYSLTLPVMPKGNVGAYNKIALNREFLMDAVKPFAMAEIQLNSNSSPVKITGEVEGLSVTVMPMFVQW